jgi:hypothetical protein
MTSASMQRVMDGCDTLINSVTDNLKSVCINFLKSNKFDLGSPNVSAFLNKFEVDSPFQKIKNIDSQIRYFKKNFNLIEPVEIMLGRRLETRLSRGGVSFHPVMVNETCQYVPIIESLKLIVGHEDIRKSIENESASSQEGRLHSFIDAKSFKENSFFQRYPHAIRIILYYDDVEIVNPLGSKTIIHKLGAFYFTIQNLPQHLQSFLGGIHLLTLCHSEDTKKYGFEPMLMPFLNDLKKLESDEGVTIDLPNEKYILRATLAAFCADGLAAHQMFGLLGPSSRFFCRSCMISREQLLSGEFREGNPRSKDLFDYQVQQAKDDPQHNPTLTGVRTDCILNKLRYFHCADNHIFDAMHDLLEGICPMEIKLVLHELIVVKGLFTVDLFNSRIALFNYGYFERKNKPSPNFTMNSVRNINDHSIKQKAMQTWCLVRVFPFLISDKVGEDDPYMELILLLQRIMEIVFAPTINRSILPLLNELINDHNHTFLSLFPEKNMINKHHHLVHYPKCIDMFGPMVHLWCMRFEAKHHMFKRHASVCCNFKNITKTMSRIAQLSQCNHWGYSENVCDNKLECSNGESVTVNDVIDSEFFIHQGSSLSDLVFVTKKAQFNGNEYVVGAYIVLSSGSETAENLPLFGIIIEIVVMDEKLVFLTVEKVRSTHYEIKYNAFAISHSKKNKQQETVRVEDLADNKCVCAWMAFFYKQHYIHLRHLVMS